jgi:tetratricopeptide (TPR) repeat protein
MNLHRLLPALLVLGACTANRVRERPILVNGDKMQTPDELAANSRVRGDAERALYAQRRDSIAAAAAASCSGEICSALTRGEVMLGMNTAQVMAATKTTGEAWSVRYAGRATVMVGARPSVPPRDVNGELGLVQLEDGKVSSYGYREPQGLRVIAAASDASAESRAKAQAAALIKEGDDFNLVGKRAEALDRYDRALLMDGSNAMLQYKVATLLDLQLRPQEALMRYERFLQQMRIQTIQAQGDAAAKQAEAIAMAQQRIVILQQKVPTSP